MLSHVRARTQFLEAMEECAYEIQEARRWRASLERYEKLLQDLAGDVAGGAAQVDAEVRRPAEAELRRFGTEILTNASDLLSRERRSMSEMLQTASFAAMALLVVMVLLTVFLADQLARQVIRPIGRFIRYVGRIADGDSSPIVPARR